MVGGAGRIFVGSFTHMTALVCFALLTCVLATLDVLPHRQLSGGALSAQFFTDHSERLAHGNDTSGMWMYQQRSLHPSSYTERRRSVRAQSGTVKSFGAISGAAFDPIRSSFSPADPHAAIGIDHVVNVVNVHYQVFTKQGQLVGGNTLVSLFRQTADPPQNTFLFDPKIIFDQYRQRFVLVALESFLPERLRASIFIAVSKSSDPLVGWRTQRINSVVRLASDGTTRWADYPGLAISANAVYVTGVQICYGGGPENTKALCDQTRSAVWVVRKSGLYDASGLSVVSQHDPWPVGAPQAPVMPTHMFGVGNAFDTYLVAHGFVSGVVDRVSVIGVGFAGGAGFGAVSFAQQLVDLGDVHDERLELLPPAPQQNAAFPGLNTLDTRTQCAVWRDNSLWAVNTVVPKTGVDAGENTVHWVEIGTFSGSAALLQAGFVGGNDIAPATHTYYPSIAVNDAGEMAIGFAASGPALHASAFYTCRTATAAAGSTVRPFVLQVGLNAYVSPGSRNRNRWGDYSATLIDPVDDSFWVYNVYAARTLNRWATKYGKFNGCSGAGSGIDGIGGVSYFA